MSKQHKEATGLCRFQKYIRHHLSQEKTLSALKENAKKAGWRYRTRRYKNGKIRFTINMDFDI